MDSGYTQPPYKHMTTKQAQKNALATLRAEASKCHTSHQQQESTLFSTIKHLVANKSNGLARALLQSINIDKMMEPHQFQATTLLQSSAEHTITRELAKQTGRANENHPICPETGYMSKFPLTFRGCYGCGETTLHTHFKDCPYRGDKTATAQFHKEYKLHSPIPKCR